jgi:transcriptional regulator with XRE-family HTH domain
VSIDFEGKKLFSLAEVASVTGISKATLYRWATGKTRRGETPITNRFRDKFTGQIYLDEETVGRLKGRFETVQVARN